MDWKKENKEFKKDCATIAKKLEWARQHETIGAVVAAGLHCTTFMNVQGFGDEATELRNALGEITLRFLAELNEDDVDIAENNAAMVNELQCQLIRAKMFFDLAAAPGPVE